MCQDFLPSPRREGRRGYKGLRVPHTLVAAQAVRWSGIPRVARSRLTQCSKSCDLQPARIAVCNTWSSGGTALCRVVVQPVN